MYVHTMQRTIDNGNGQMLITDKARIARLASISIAIRIMIMSDSERHEIRGIRNKESGQGKKIEGKTRSRWIVSPCIGSLVLVNLGKRTVPPSPVTVTVTFHNLNHVSTFVTLALSCPGFGLP